MQNKNSWEQNQKSTDKIKAFFERNGFYVVLFGCLSIIGATALLTYNATQDSQKEMSQADQLEQEKPVTQSNDESIENVFEPPSTIQSAQIVGANPQKAQENKTSEQPIQQTDETTQKQLKSSKQKIFVAPVSGKISLEYAADKLVYSKTLDQWSVHNGIDITADNSAPVSSIANGIVEKVYTDPLMGYTIIIDHEEIGLKSVYSSLEELPKFAQNEKINAGQIVGKIGRSAMSESEDAPHVHFELWSKNKPIDPTKKLSGLN